jgi:hypothetical protein
VGHAYAPPPREGARGGASEHPPRCHGCAVAQGVQAGRFRPKGCYYEVASEAEMSTHAASGPLPSKRLRRKPLPFTVYIAYLLSWIISIRVNIVVAKQIKAGKLYTWPVRESFSVFGRTQLLSVCDSSRTYEIKTSGVYVFCSRSINSTTTTIQRHLVQQ